MRAGRRRPRPGLGRAQPIGAPGQARLARLLLSLILTGQVVNRVLSFAGATNTGTGGPGPREENTVKEEVQAVLDQIRPALQADGGDVELVEVTDDGVVKVHLVGACAGCPMSQLTLSNGVERVLKQQIPSVTRVEPV